MNEIVAAAYERWAEGDVDGFLAVFDEEAVFVVPGTTRLSGEHDKAAFRRVLAEVVAATKDGRHRQDLVCSYEGPSGEMAIFDTLVSLNGDEVKYHSGHEWIIRDGQPKVWMLYVHEYDLFDRAWS